MLLAPCVGIPVGELDMDVLLIMGEPDIDMDIAEPIIDELDDAGMLGMPGAIDDIISVDLFAQRDRMATCCHDSRVVVSGRSGGSSDRSPSTRGARARLYAHQLPRPAMRLASGDARMVTAWA